MAAIALGHRGPRRHGTQRFRRYHWQPTFLGGMKISSAMGPNFREWLANCVAHSRSGGRTDLVAYFFLRAYALLRKRGSLGLIATNTIAQGDTREVGLDRMVKLGFTIFRAIQSRSWPAASANLEYAAVWGYMATYLQASVQFATRTP